VKRRVRKMEGRSVKRKEGRVGRRSIHVMYEG
jgi:hypothetical protein